MEFCLDLEAFERFLPGNLGGNELKIDLSECNFVRPEGALALFLLLRHSVERGVRPTVIRPKDSGVDSYFERTGVPYLTFECVTYEPHADDLIMRSWTERETMQEITQVTSKKDVGKIVDKCGLALERQFQSEDIVRSLKSAMVETFQNMPDHANPGSPSDFEGYTNIQSYSKGKRVVVAAGDLGVGIKGSLQTSRIYGRNFMTDLQAMELAVFERASRYAGSIDANEHGGGLHLAMNLVKALRGITVVRSGRAALIIKPWGPAVRRENLKFFPGTQITITVSGS